MNMNKLELRGIVRKAYGLVGQENPAALSSASLISQYETGELIKELSAKVDKSNDINEKILAELIKLNSKEEVVEPMPEKKPVAKEKKATKK